MKKLQLNRLGPNPCSAFPPTSQALEHPNGLLAWGGDLKPARLLEAYRQGIFPWYSPGEPLLWWSPAPRCVLMPGDVHVSRRTRRRFRSSDYRVQADTAFSEVIKACAEPRKQEAGTWISEEMQLAYLELHHAGIAHSIEVWSGPALVGGIYGLSIGKVFFGESMFSRQTDTSKIALISLCRQLHAWNYGLLDCQIENPHLVSMGAINIGRQDFEAHLEKLTAMPGRTGSWIECFNAKLSW